MFLDLLKCLKETSFYKKREKKNENAQMKFHKTKVHIKNLNGFLVKKELILWLSGSKRIFFSAKEIGRKIIFP